MPLTIIMIFHPITFDPSFWLNNSKRCFFSHVFYVYIHTIQAWVKTVLLHRKHVLWWSPSVQPCVESTAIWVLLYGMYNVHQIYSFFFHYTQIMLYYFRWAGNFHRELKWPQQQAFIIFIEKIKRISTWKITSFLQ